MTTCGHVWASTYPGSQPNRSARTGYATPTLTWVERNFGHAVARAYAGHCGSGHGEDTTALYTRAGLEEVAAALAALTGEAHPLAPRCVDPPR